jgi:hypothetical protein
MLRINGWPIGNSGLGSLDTTSGSPKVCGQPKLLVLQSYHIEHIYLGLADSRNALLLLNNLALL